MTEPAAPADPYRLTATVSGAVQGVGFRYWTRGQAETLGLTGTAANQPDGTVLVVAEGSRAALEDLVQALKSPHTPGRVAQVAVEFGPADGRFQTFREQ